MSTHIENSNGVAVKFYPARLYDRDLSFLIEVTGGRLAGVAEAYAEWLNRTACQELERRASLQTDVPYEPEVPLFDGTRWTSDDLASALKASGVLLALTRDGEREVLLELLKQLDLMIRGWTAARLRRLNSE
jgi:hypothetical protein